ncbi:MAG: DUF2244 domain-containing protein [Alphaproteobacteria bacterium]|nr:DUF2244 domain-containing protein [Alphaproteobacteria bacterium]
MGILCAASFLSGCLFVALGAWPVVGFLGADIVLVWIAFRVSYARAAASERLTLHADRFEIVRTDRAGRVDRRTLEPYWLKVRIEHRGAGAPAVRLASHGRTTTIGRFLGPAERIELAHMIEEALARWRQSPSTSRIE